MKKLFLLILTSFLLISLTACSSDGPEATLAATMKSFQQTDSLISLLNNFTEKSQIEMTQSISNEIGEVDISDMLYVDELYKKLNPTLIKNLEYEIISVQEEDNNAIVNVKVTNMDLEPVMKFFVPKIFSYVMTLALTEDMSAIEDMNEEEQKEYSKKYVTELIDLFIESVNDVEDVTLVTNEVAIKMTKSEDEKWYIDDPEFLLYLLGNIEESMVSSLEDIGSNFGFELEE
jgi:hypothetical protein